MRAGRFHAHGDPEVLMHISGADVSGEVVDAPGGEFAVGTRVLLQPGLSCGRCAAWDRLPSRWRGCTAPT